MINSLKYIVISVFVLFVFFSCERDEFNTSSNAKLKFSTDTVQFDTIFTTIGSTTKRFTVRNPYKENIEISSIRLAGGESSPFRLNIDGFSGNQLRNVELRGKDSLFIFVEITIDIDNSNLPFEVKDSIIFSFNNKQQDVKLLAWGQDVYLIRNKAIGTETWGNEKPYLLYDTVYITPNSTLTIQPGTILHFHKNSRLYVGGTIIADGTFDSPIIFQGDRLESDYENIPGQWDGIWLLQGSKDNVFDFSEIKNAIIGIQVDSIGNSNPTLHISNSKISNMTSAAIYAQESSIKAFNSVFSNCGQFALALTIGGSYEFYHCTIANFWGFSTRTTPSVLLNDYYVDIYGNMHIRPLTKALFANCIIYGNKSSEIFIDDINGNLNYKFDHSLIKVDSEFSTTNPTYFENVIVNKNPNFIDPYNGIYELDTLSVAKDFGDKDYILTYPLQLGSDINLQNRSSDLGPDLGAFERIETP